MSFALLALVCAVALLGPLGSLPRNVGVPVVIGELAVGIALGATGLRVLDATDPTFTFLGGDLGFALVMMLTGARVPLRSAGLRSGLRVGALRAALVGVAAVPAGLGLAALFGTGNGALYAVVLASSSAALILPSLGDAPLTGRPMLAMLAQVAVADAACIIALPLAVDPSAAGGRVLGVLAVVGAAALVYVVASWGERTGRRRTVHDLSEERGLAIELRVSLTVLFTLAALSQVTGVSVMLAGFATGLILAGIGEPRRLSRQLFALTEGFFSPLFFVWLGASLDLRAVGADPRLLALGLALGAAAVVVHAAVALTGQPLPLAATTGAQLGVPVAAATLGHAEGVLAPGEDAALLIGALVTIAVTTALSGRVARLARRSAEGDGAGDAKGK